METKTPTRFCPRHNDYIPETCFRKKKSGRWESYCIGCTKEYKKEQYKKAPSKALARAKKWAEENAEKYKENQDRYREEHREELNLAAKQYRIDNKEEVQEREHNRNKSPERKQWKKEYRERRLQEPEYKEYILALVRKANRKHYQNHKEEILENKYYSNKEFILEERKQRYKEDPEYKAMMKASGKQWIKNHPGAVKALRHKRRMKEYNNGGSFTEEDIIKLITKQESKCRWCSKDLDNQYHIDHVIPISKGGANSPLNLTISCPECNQSKGNKLPYTEWIPPNFK